MQIPKQGVIVAGKFYRGGHRGGDGRWVNASARDRVRALQLMMQALPNARKDDDHAKVAGYLLAWADMLLNNRGYQESWRLQYKTDLAVLPDYEEGWPWSYRRRAGSGGPGRRGRQARLLRHPQGLGAIAERRPALAMVPRSRRSSSTRSETNFVRMKFADFLQQQFGVQTMAQFGWRFGRLATDDSKEDQSGTYALATLGEDETVARLATGVKRFKLPEEFNFIKIYQQVADDPKAGDGGGAAALDHLATEFENRRQYPKAADYSAPGVKEYPNDFRARRTSQTSTTPKAGSSVWNRSWAIGAVSSR